MKKLTVRDLALQLQAQGKLILELREDSARRDRLAVANAVSRTVSEEARADLPEVARDEDYGRMVREPTIAEIIREENDRVIKNVSVIVHEALRELPVVRRRR